jgi:hypothetical protein
MKNFLNISIALIWIMNGLYCKILDYVPRHKQIISEILNKTYSREITILIGISELFMAFWILSRYQSKINAYTQILIIITMNIIEFLYVPDLLLWGQFNIIWSIVLCVIIYWNAFKLKEYV